jgi:hypothetical protein
MEVAAASTLAREVAHTDRPMILSISEPDSPRRHWCRKRPRAWYAPARRATCHRPDHLRGASAAGTARLRLDVPARRIVVTADASAALQLACRLIEAGDEMPPDPYPCNATS